MDTIKAVAGLRHFQIKGNGSAANGQVCKVYKNGRQEFQVTVVIDAVDHNNQSIRLTPAQMRQVVLVRYDSGESLPAAFRGSYVWAGYDYTPALQPADSASVAADMSVLDMWVSVGPTASFHSMQIGAKITLEGVTYSTNNPSVNPGGAVAEGGRSNSSIFAEALVPYAFRANDFAISRIVQGIGWGPASPKRHLDLWEIKIQNSNYKIVDSDVPVAPWNRDTVIWFSRNDRSSDNDDTTQWALPMRTPGYRTIYLHSDNGLPDCYIQPNYQPGRAYAVVERYEGSTPSDYKSLPITYTDNNGCNHSIYLKPVTSGYDFALSDYP